MVNEANYKIIDISNGQVLEESNNADPSESIYFNCKHCGQKLEVERAEIGSIFPCAACGKEIQVPNV